MSKQIKEDLNNECKNDILEIEKLLLKEFPLEKKNSRGPPYHAFASLAFVVILSLL